MTSRFAAMALAPALLCAVPAAADIAGAWHVTGKISDTSFDLGCKFEPKGTSDFGGACIEGPGNAKVAQGTVHPLSKGFVAGSQAHWSYKVHVMMFTLDADFVGALDGDHMTGTISIAGRKGEFTAVRK